MSVNSIDAALAKQYFIAGAKNLEANRSWIDELNVFPVPDGDTGTNMTMTLLSAVSEVSKVEGTLDDVCKAISKGSLRGARGNSGVITSQILRGFCRNASNYEVLTLKEVIEGFEKAVDTAYKAVMKPKEGTILTVARGMYEKALEFVDSEISIDEFLGKVIEHGEEVLAQTPEMLPVLKQAGVVDSGGQGLILFVKGIHDAMLGKAPVYEEAKSAPAVHKESPETFQSLEDIKFGYCTEFIVNLDRSVSGEELAGMKDFLDGIGDSIVLVADDDFIKIHVHTNEPGNVLQRALTFGELTRIKIDNMREEHREMLGISTSGGSEREASAALAGFGEVKMTTPVKEERKPFGFIAVAAGDGFKEIFDSMGVDKIISGGQTMNPCTEDFLKAVEEINADTIFIFPNNSNIIMAANQARDMTEDKTIIVIPTKTVPQGITAMITFSPDMSGEDNEAEMNEVVGTVKSASITYAIRDTSLDGYEIHEGDIMSVGDKGILSVGSSIEEVAVDSIKKLVDEDSELVSIYVGEDFSMEKAEALEAKLEEEGIDCDVEIQDGGQPVYYCIISVE